MLHEETALYELKVTRTRKQLEKHHFDMSSAIAAMEIAREVIGDPLQEHLYCFGLDAKNNVVSYWLVTIGVADRAHCHAREIFRPAILENCSRVLLAHNHPSGDPTPSKADITVTKAILAAGEVIGIKLIDHIIIGQPEAMSFREDGLVF